MLYYSFKFFIGLNIFIKNGGKNTIWVYKGMWSHGKKTNSGAGEIDLCTLPSHVVSETSVPAWGMAAGGRCGLCADRLQLRWLPEVQTHEAFPGLSPVRSQPLGAGWTLQTALAQSHQPGQPHPSQAKPSRGAPLTSLCFIRTDPLGAKAPGLTLAAPHFIGG